MKPLTEEQRVIRKAYEFMVDYETGAMKQDLFTASAGFAVLAGYLKKNPHVSKGILNANTAEDVCPKCGSEYKCPICDRENELDGKRNYATMEEVFPDFTAEKESEE